MAVQLSRQCNVRVEDLDSLGLPDKFVELIEGEIIQMTPAGRRHNDAAYHVARLFEDFCATHPELTYGADNEGFLIKRNPDTLVSPDACLFKRRPASESTWMEFTPEVAVEVISPSNSAAEMAFKRQCYFDAGTEQFWLIDPVKQQIEIHYHDGKIELGSGDQLIVGSGIVEGMRMDVAGVFRER